MESMPTFIILILFLYVIASLVLLHRLYLRVWRAAQHAERIKTITMLNHSALMCRRKMRGMNVNTHEDQLDVAGMDGARIALSEFAEALSETLYDKTQ